MIFTELREGCVYRYNKGDETNLYNYAELWQDYNQNSNHYIRPLNEGELFLVTATRNNSQEEILVFKQVLAMDVIGWLCCLRNEDNIYGDKTFTLFYEPLLSSSSCTTQS